MNETIGMLQELLEQNQFELLIPEEPEAKDIRLVYLMNDAVESFLIFRNACMTGTYKSEYEGELEFSLSHDEKREEYILSVWQGDSVVTILFPRLELEVHLYNYGGIAHFWVPGYEYLRQLEYRIAILRDKLDYLGEEYCTPGEQKLAMLTDFPPLNYCCYPAVPAKYIVPIDDPWSPSLEALEVMEELAEEAGDQSFQKILKAYRHFPVRPFSRWIGRQLRRKKHAPLVDLLTDRICEETKKYPCRSYGGTADREIGELLKKAESRKAELLEKRKARRIEVMREEPFTTAKDSLGFQVWVMIYQDGVLNRRVIMEKIEG